MFTRELSMDQEENWKDWSRDELTELIKLYKRHPCLWDNHDDQFRNREKRRQIYSMIAKTLSRNVIEVYKKIRNLRTQWQTEQKKSLEKSGRVPKWWCYELLSFLESNTPHQTLSKDISDMSDDKHTSSLTNDISDASASPVSEIEFVEPMRKPSKRKDKRTRATRPSAHNPAETADDDKIFGDYVASVLRNFSSKQSKKKFRRIVQKAIVDLQDEEDDFAVRTSYETDSS